MRRCVEEQPGCAGIMEYVPGKPIEEVKREYGIEDVIKLASNENPLGPSPKAVSAIRQALDRLNQYPDGQSYYLRHALARYLSVNPAQVTVGNGADGLIVQICLAYLDSESEVVVSDCSFPIYDTYTRVMRATLTKTPMRDFRFDLQAMAAAINERTKLAFVCNPNNPTGTIVTANEVDAFMERVPDRVLVVFDEAYFEFVDSDQYPDTLRYIREGRKNVLTMRTFSKSYGLAGLRLGYAIAEPEVLAPLCKVKEPFTVNLLAQAGCIAALEDEEFLDLSITTNRIERRFLYDEFQRMGLPYVESHANFVLVHVGPDAGEVFERMLTRGVIVRPCPGYGIPEHVRITIGEHSQNLRLVSDLEEVLEEVRG